MADTNPTQDEIDAARHQAVLRQVRAALLADESVSLLCGDRVYLPGDVPPSPALPCVTLAMGRRYRPQNQGAPTLRQMDVRLTARAGSEAAMGLVVVACQTALNGKPGGEAYSHGVLTNTGPVDEDGGVWSREDRYGCHVRPLPAGARTFTPARERAAAAQAAPTTAPALTPEAVAAALADPATRAAVSDLLAAAGPTRKRPQAKPAPVSPTAPPPDNGDPSEHQE